MTTPVAAAPAAHAGLVVSSPGAAFTTVRLVRDLPLGDPGYDLPVHLTVSDPAHFVGVALVNTKVVTAQGFTGHLSVLAMSLPDGSGGYRYEQRPTGALTSLPRGTYWLVVLATAPERVSWPLAVSGTYRATHRATYASTLTSGRGPDAHSYGHARLTGPTELWSYVWAHGSDLAFSADPSCIYDGTDAAALAAEPLPAEACTGDLAGTDGMHAALPGDAVAWSTADITSGWHYWPNVGAKFSDEYAGDVQWTAGRQIWLTLPS
ncbi:MAG: hypothetical protein QOD07_1580 [Frankiaceae bacterium]|nr:hypothetical protein [Frankiaceae bacterium]